MGVDIHMHIIDKDNNLLHKEIFSGRNSEWFNNLQGNGWANEYDHLPIKFGVPENFFEKHFKEITENWDEPVTLEEYLRWHYGYNHIIVRDFIAWFQKYSPDVDAGWVSSYDKWAYEVKHIIPQDPPHYKPEGEGDDWHFITFEKEYDCSAWLYNWLDANNIQYDDIIVYYFDC